MKNTILTLLFSCSIHFLFAQISITGKVIDAETKAAVPYVNIGVKKLAKGTVSDDNGKFVLGKISAEDLVSFSSIGFESVDIPARELQGNGLIALTKTAYEINTIKVEATRFDGDEKIFGVRNETRGHSIGFGNAQLGTEIGSPIFIDRPTYIKSTNLVLNHAKGDSLLLRINIYQFDDDNIGDKILTENVFIKDKQRKGTITVDMTPYNLVLNQDVLLTVEWLRNFDEIGNKDITFDTKKAKKLTGVYYRIFSNGAFSRMPVKKKIKACFYFVGKQAK